MAKHMQQKLQIRNAVHKLRTTPLLSDLVMPNCVPMAPCLEHRRVLNGLSLAATTAAAARRRFSRGSAVAVAAITVVVSSPTAEGAQGAVLREPADDASFVKPVSTRQPKRLLHPRRPLIQANATAIATVCPAGGTLPLRRHVWDTNNWQAFHCGFAQDVAIGLTAAPRTALHHHVHGPGLLEDIYDVLCPATIREDDAIADADFF